LSEEEEQATANTNTGILRCAQDDGKVASNDGKVASDDGKVASDDGSVVAKDERKRTRWQRRCLI
jgi:predicted carbohydrate-binding protein with CBM5 and CBM33 domain